jgi:hypothetical protein
MKVLCKDVLRASPLVHWKLTCTPLLDELIYRGGVKTGAGTPDCCQILGFQETRENKKNTAASWVFAFAARTLTATDWLAALIGPPCDFYMIPQCIIFTIYRLWVGREKLLTQNLDVKTWRAGHFPVKHR